jgi:hypothetical protein
MAPVPEQALSPGFEQTSPGIEQVLPVRAAQRLVAEHGLARQRWRCQPWPLNLGYCREQDCWMMTWGLGSNSLRVWPGIRVTKVTRIFVRILPAPACGNERQKQHRWERIVEILHFLKHTLSVIIDRARQPAQFPNTI